MANLLKWYRPDDGSEWDTTAIYKSTTYDGVYTSVAQVVLPTTEYFDAIGSTTDYYKIAYYDSVSDTTGSQSEYFQGQVSNKVVTSTLYVTPSEVRRFMVFDQSDPPSDEEMLRIIESAHIPLEQDKGTISFDDEPLKVKFLALLISSSFVCRSLAAKAISKGYISINLEGINVNKAFDAFNIMSDRFYQAYMEQLAKDTIDYATTTFLGSVNVDTVSQIRDIMNGVSDGFDFENRWRMWNDNRSSSN